MLILGIDPGLDTTGYGIIEKQARFKYLESGFIKTNAKENIDKRLLGIYQNITNIIRKYKFDAIVLEKLYAHYKHPTTACLLGHARGIICFASAQNNIPLFEYSATRIKKSILGNGHASKMQIQKMVLNTLGLTEEERIPLDVTDALSLAIAHLYITRNSNLQKAYDS